MQTKDPNLTKTPVADHNQSAKADSVEQVDTTVEKGSNTLTNDEVDSKHVNEGDNPARQPDRRDQQGSTPFDGNVNKDTISDNADNGQKAEVTEQPQSDEITEKNRYATINNAQTRVLDEDSK